MPEILDLQCNGIRMRMADSGGSGRTLVFLHGLGWDHRMWDRAFALYMRDYRVVAGDTRGHGASDAPAGPYSIRQFADDWQCALDALGVGQACLVGFSQGGMIAMQLALDNPQRFERLVLASTTSRASEQARAKMEQRIDMMRSGDPRAAARLAVDSIFSKSFAASNPSLVESIIDARAAAAPEPLIDVMRAGRGFDVSDRLSTLSIPALVIAGSDDGLIPCSITEQLATQLPRARFARIEGAGHMLPVEQPDAFYDLIGRYLCDHYPASDVSQAAVADRVQA